MMADQTQQEGANPSHDASVQPETQDSQQQQQQQQQEQPSMPAQTTSSTTTPLLPPIQQTTQTPSGNDQSQGPMQASSPQQHQQQQQQQQQQPYAMQQQAPPSVNQAAQHHPPTQHAPSPITNQPQYEHAPSPIPPQPHYEPASQHPHYAQSIPPHQQPPPPQAQQSQQVQYELPPPQANGAPPGYAPAQQIPPPHHNPYQYQHQQPQQYPPQPANGDANGFPAQMRYSMPLPPNQMNNQQLQGTRHKKEIKRRTKTGCLTCRKRRIKCDEGHPTCRNCQKSKRECLGYDPIFKAQTGQPANIQPQPGSLPPPPDSQSPHPPPPLVQPQYSNVPQGYVPASSAGYAPAPAMQNQLDQSYDYGSAIDPALAAAHPGAEQPPPPMPPPQEQYTTILLPERNVRLITMDDVYHLDSIPPTFPNSRDLNVQPLPQHDLDAIRDLYLREYAPGLDRFFETDWYGMQGLNILMSDQEILKYFAHCLDRFRHPPSENNKGLPSIEARLIWVLASMAFAHPPGPQGPLNFLPRIEAVSHIILGTFMPPERVPPAPTTMPDPKNQPDAYAFYLQDLFWHHLSTLTTIRDDNTRQPTSGQEIANQLAGMRNILSMLENRDVLYSMAIARHFGGRMEHYDADKILIGNRGTAEAEDPLNKLAVALGFLVNEEMQGTTQVVQRLCGMSRRGFQLQRLDSLESVVSTAHATPAAATDMKMENGAPPLPQSQQHQLPTPGPASATAA